MQPKNGILGVELDEQYLGEKMHQAEAENLQQQVKKMCNIF